MKWLRILSGRKSRNMALSILGIAIGATALGIARRRNNRSTFLTPIKRLFR